MARPTMRQTARQELQLLPQMVLAVEVLQLPAAELAGYVLRAFEENEALRLERPPAAPEPPARAGRPGAAEASERHHAWLESREAPEKGLADAAREQLGLVDVDGGLLPWVHVVLDHLDPCGTLSTPDEALLAAAAERGLAADPGRLGRAIALVQTLEPAGIGGRDAVESLLLQLDPRDPDYALLCRLLEEFLDELARNKLPSVARALGVDLERLGALVARLRELELRPGAAAGGEAAPTVRPEVVVERTAEGFEVRVEDAGLPAVALDPRVRRLASDPALPEAERVRLRERVERARWLVRALEQRVETLQRVAAALFAHQTPFLEHGPGHLVPLTMTSLAGWLGVHTSTVSRAVAGKHAQTPWGVWPLRHFFQGGAGSGEGAARTDVRELVRAVVGEEDPARPLSDDAIVERLAARGHPVARRTVAKYREELGIPSSYRRRRYA